MRRFSRLSPAWVSAVLILLDAAAVPASAQQAAAYTNTFDNASSVSGWYFSYDDWNAVQWWNVDNDPVEGHSPTTSLNFNNGTDIDADYPWSYFDTTPIDVSGMTTPTFTFWCRYETNNDPYFDYRQVYIYDPVNGESIYYVFNVDNDGDGQVDIDCGAMNEWHQHTISLPDTLIAQGTIVIQFYLSSSGSYEGSGLDGWFLDDFQFLVPDVTPPAAISDLAAGGATLTSLTVTWSSPTDDDVSGVCESFDIRYSATPIDTDADFDAASPVAGAPDPDVAGTAHSVILTGLTDSTTYHFAIKTTDKAGNVSGLSNVAGGTTLPPPPPPPPPPAGVTAQKDRYSNCGAGVTGSPVGLAAMAALLAVLGMAGLLRR